MALALAEQEQWLVRVLHYNWVDPDDPARRGGGVRVYAQALAAEQRATLGYDCTALSAGLAHGLRGGAAPCWRRRGPARLELFDSAPLAPSHADFASPAQLSHPPTVATFADLLKRTGPYDVVHFHALEGLPAEVLALRRDFPRTRFVLSLHNYYPLCPQVNLWWRESAPCTDFAGGAACVGCLPVTPNPRAVRRAYAVETALARMGAPAGSAVHDRILRPALRGGWAALKALRARRPRARGAAPAGPGDAGAAAAAFARRGADMIALINAHCDAVLAVSDRTRQIARDHGMNGVQTLRIGTDHAAAWAATAPPSRAGPPSAADPLRLAFLGYMRRDKGFFFLMQALQALSAAQASRLHLTVAAPAGPRDAIAAMRAAGARLAGLAWHDGYTPDALAQILAGVEFGIVPPLWEDNLPQVALEMHARHIPLITSDRGGARELAGTRALVFRAGDTADFARVLAQMLDGAPDMARYWAQATPPTTMVAHARALDRVYRGLG